MFSEILNVAGIGALDPEVAQTFLKHPDVRMQRSVALNPNVADEIKVSLVSCKDLNTRCNAVSTIKDASLLATYSRSGPERQTAVAANPHTNAETLANLSLVRSNTLIARAALLNPNLPLELGLELGSFSAAELFGEGLSCYTPSGVGSILTLHPELASCWVDDRDGGARRVVARMPDIKPEMAEKLSKRKGGSCGDALATNPYVPQELLSDKGKALRERMMSLLDDRDPMSIGQATIEEQCKIAWFGSYTLDVILAKQDKIDISVLEMASGRGNLDGTLRAKKTTAFLLDGDVLACMIDKSSADAISVARGGLSSSKLKAAGVHSKAMRRSEQHLPSHLDKDRADKAVKALGDDRRLWETLISLSSNWVGSFEDLIEAAIRV